MSRITKVKIYTPSGPVEFQTGIDDVENIEESAHGVIIAFKWGSGTNSTKSRRKLYYPDQFLRVTEYIQYG